MPSRVTNGEEEEDEPQGFQYGIPPMVWKCSRLFPGMKECLNLTLQDGMDSINFAFALYPLPMPHGHSEL